jgi:hypothetical protein
VNDSPRQFVDAGLHWLTSALDEKIRAGRLACRTNDIAMLVLVDPAKHDEGKVWSVMREDLYQDLTATHPQALQTRGKLALKPLDLHEVPVVVYYGDDTIFSFYYALDKKSTAGILS